VNVHDFEYADEFVDVEDSEEGTDEECKMEEE
jgi:hypothetical protein